MPGQSRRRSAVRRPVSAAAGLALALLAAPAASAQEGGEAPPRRVRPIAPQIVAPPPTGPDALERTAPRAPLSAPPDSARRAGPARLFRPVATAAGRLEAEGLTVLLSGLQVVEPDRLCDAADGGTWPCGMRARTAFRGLLRGRAVECDLDDGAAGGAGTVTARCALAGRDLGRWLVEHGWALAAPGGPYGQAAAAARAERRGLFGGGRR